MMNSKNNKFRLLYIILGFLNEYSNGYKLDSNIVTAFYSNELLVAKLFEKICKKYLIQNGLNCDVELIKNQNNTFELRSTEIASIIKTIYTKFNEYGMSNIADDNLLNQEINHSNIACKTSYLVGVVLRLRNTEGSMISFSNASNKVKLTIKLLSELKQNNPSDFTMNFIEGYPDVTEFYFLENSSLIASVRHFEAVL